MNSHDTTPTPSPSATYEDLLDGLARDGAFPNAAIKAAFAAEPREHYVPRFYEPWNGQWRPVTPGTRHYHRVNTDSPLVASVRNDGRQRHLRLTPRPSTIAAMLGALDARSGQAVTLIGTVTGYTAALLTHLIGHGHLTVLDPDESLLENSRTNLAPTGHHDVSLVLCDAFGPDARLPSAERILATTALTTIPATWLRALPPGGRLLAPISTGLAVMDKTENGQVIGRFLPGHVPPIHAQDPPESDDITQPPDPDGPPTPFSMPAAVWWEDPDFRFTRELLLPGLRAAWPPHPSRLVIWDAAGSCALIDAATARQSGPRRLADELDRVWNAFLTAGSPPPERYAVNVTPQGEPTYRVTDLDNA